MFPCKINTSVNNFKLSTINSLITVDQNRRAILDTENSFKETLFYQKSKTEKTFKQINGRVVFGGKNNSIE